MAIKCTGVAGRAFSGFQVAGRNLTIWGVVLQPNFVNAQLIKVVLDSADGELPCWRLATIQITRHNARAILGEPHFIETDSRATAGGEEDHWTYLAPHDLPTFFRLRVPYDTMDLCSTSPAFPDDSWRWVKSLFKDFEIQRLDSPHNELPS